MHKIYQLRDKLCEELEGYAQGELTQSTLDVIDKLAHATKNIDKLLETYEQEQEEYSGRNYYDGGGGSYGSYGRSYDRSYGRSYEGNSMARKRDSKGRYARDYSRRPMDERINEMMMNDPDMQSRDEWQKYANRMDG